MTDFKTKYYAYSDDHLEAIKTAIKKGKTEHAINLLGCPDIGYNVMRSLLDKIANRVDIAILRHLFNHGEKSKYQLSKELEKSYSLIHGSISLLKDRNLVKISSNKVCERNPTISVEYYELTNIGLKVLE